MILDAVIFETIEEKNNYIDNDSNNELEEGSSAAWKEDILSLKARQILLIDNLELQIKYWTGLFPVFFSII